MRTDSIRFWSRKRKRNFRVVSFEPRTRTTSVFGVSNSAVSSARNSLGKSVIASKEATRFVDPVGNLLRAIGRRAPLAEKTRQFFQDDSGERGLHAGVYAQERKKEEV